MPEIIKPSTKTRAGRCTNWESFNTYGGPPLPQHFIRDAAAILENITTSGNTGRLFKLKNILQRHLDNEDDIHGMDMQHFKEEVLKELYTAYRLSGKTGTKEDMLRSIFDFVEIVDPADLALGNDSKAVNATKFHSDFLRHEGGFDSHFGLFAKFMFKDIFDHHPVVHLSEFYKTTRYYKESYLDTYKIGLTKVLNRNELVQTKGTIVVDLKLLPVTNTVTLVELEGLRGSTKVLFTPTSYLVVLQKGFAIDKEIFRLELPNSELARIKLVMGFKDGVAKGRHSLSNVMEGNYLTNEFDYRKVIIPVFGRIEDNCYVRSFTYFNDVVETEEQMIFLLD